MTELAKLTSQTAVARSFEIWKNNLVNCKIVIQKLKGSSARRTLTNLDQREH